MSFLESLCIRFSAPFDTGEDGKWEIDRVCDDNPHYSSADCDLHPSMVDDLVPQMFGKDNTMTFLMSYIRQRESQRSGGEAQHS